MNTTYAEEWPQFYTASILQWQLLLADDACKNIVVESLQFLVSEKRIALYGFVIMSNHIHLIWQPLAGYTVSGMQSSFMKYTAQQFKRHLQKNDETLLANFKVNKHDREYQFWKREPLNVELITPAVFAQKLDYIHYNAVRAGICKYPEEYKYSSALFYYSSKDEFKMVTHYSGN
jgi:putative transposase